MKSLADFNTDRMREWDLIDDSGSPKPNGISCPDCGGELVDTRPDVMLPSNPPKKDVNCPACKFKGYRVA